MNPWLAVFLGGGAGSMVRFAISQLFQRIELKGQFPWATLTTNLIATALLAWLVLRFEVHLPGREQWRALLAVGFCGGFSTLSTFSLENYQLLREGLVGFAVLNVLLSVGVGVLLFYLMSRSS
jgi:CrcB protein